jgi:hypothetical protein
LIDVVVVTTRIDPRSNTNYRYACYHLGARSANSSFFVGVWRAHSQKTSCHWWKATMSIAIEVIQLPLIQVMHQVK